MFESISINSEIDREIGQNFFKHLYLLRLFYTVYEEFTYTILASQVQ